MRSNDINILYIEDYIKLIRNIKRVKDLQDLLIREHETALHNKKQAEYWEDAFCRVAQALKEYK